MSKSADQREASQSSRFFSTLLQLRIFLPLRHREYRLLWYGHSLTSMAQWMDEVSRGWLMYELTDSVVQLGLVRGVQAIPYLLLSPVAGSAADRYSRKSQLIIAQVAAGLIHAVTALLIFTGRIRPWHLYITSFLMASAQAFLFPARASMISDAVPASSLTNAIGLGASMFNAARSIGPALAGMLIVLSSTGGTYAVQAVLFFLATIWTLQMHPLQRSLRTADGRLVHGESFGQSMIEGCKFGWRNETVRAGLLTVMSASLFIVPFTTLLPVFARDILGVGATGQGFLFTAMGIGALCSALLIASAGDKLRRGMLMMGAAILYGLTLIIFAASSWFPLSLLVMGIAGLAHVHCNALVQTVIQTYSPSKFRGRMTSLFQMSQVLMTAGSILVGSVSSFLGVRLGMASMGAVGALTILMIFVAMPKARHIR